jgi:hypothetical protein
MPTHVRSWHSLAFPIQLVLKLLSKSCAMGTEMEHELEEPNHNAPMTDTAFSRYSEAIEVIYTTNAFSFSTLTTFLLFNTLLLPSRLHNLQHLVLQFSVPFSPIVHCKQIYRPANIEWPRACAFLRTLPSLHTLTLSLKGPPIYWTGSDALGQNDSPLKQLSGVKVKREYIVFVDWRVQEVEKTLETEFGMKVLGRERVNWQEEYRS